MIIRIVHGWRSEIIAFLATPTEITEEVRKTRMTLAYVVPMKGADIEQVTEQAARDLLRFGIHGDVLEKSDQEPAIVDALMC